VGNPWDNYAPTGTAAAAPAPAAAGPWDNYAPTGTAASSSFLDDIRDTVKQYWDKVNPVTQAQGVADIATTDPRKTIQSYGKSTQQLGQKALDAFKTGDYAQGVRHSINYLANGIPGLGSALDAAGDKSGSGDYKGATADTLALATNLLAAKFGPKVLNAATEPGAIPAAVSKAAAPARAVRDFVVQPGTGNIVKGAVQGATGVVGVVKSGFTNPEGTALSGMVAAKGYENIQKGLAQRAAAQEAAAAEPAATPAANPSAVGPPAALPTDEMRIPQEVTDMPPASPARDFPAVNSPRNTTPTNAAVPAAEMRTPLRPDEMPDVPKRSAQAYANGRPVVLQEDGTPLMYTDTAEAPPAPAKAPVATPSAQPAPAPAPQPAPAPAAQTPPSAYEQHIADVRQKTGDVGADATLAKDAKFADYVQGKGMTASDVDRMDEDAYAALHADVPTGKVNKATGKPTAFRPKTLPDNGGLDYEHLAERKDALSNLLRDRELQAANAAADPEGAAAAGGHENWSEEVLRKAKADAQAAKDAAAAKP
jgi:hypothetical protein